jgi:NAD(P)-dependent dehydrogenase (short-subunit alcohol dehydrogenase family)
MVDGKTPQCALVTGAAKRIGRRIALELARKGWNVAVHFDASYDEAQGVVSEARTCGVEAMAVQGDLANPATPSRIMAEAREELGEINCLINNASLFEPDAVGTISLESWDNHLNTNLRAPVFLAQAFANQLSNDAPGDIINIIDQRVLKLNPKCFSYTASKAALWTVTRTLAQALAPQIRVNAIGPGPALPNARMDDDEFEMQKNLTLLKRGTSPKEIADTVLFILSMPAFTGQMIVLDGGQHLVWETPDIVRVNE